MIIASDIAFELKTPIFQFAQIWDYLQSTTTNAVFKCWLFKNILINADHFKSITLKQKSTKKLGLQNFGKIKTISKTNK